MKYNFTSVIVAAMLGANVCAMAQDAETPDYYVVAQGPTIEKTGTCLGQDGSLRSWWGYGEMGANFNYSLTGCNVEDLYIEFDLYVESPLAQDGYAFPNIVWGGKLPDGLENGIDEPQNYFNLLLKSASTNWSFASWDKMEAAFGDVFRDVKNGEWNHVAIPLHNSPNIESLNLNGTDFAGVSMQFMRMKSPDYVFKARNIQIVDHSKIAVDEVIPCEFTFTNPANVEEPSFNLGTPDKEQTLIYMQYTFGPVDLSEIWTKTSFAFDAEITSTKEGVELTQEMVSQLKVANGAAGLELRSGTETDKNEIEMSPRTFDWKPGKNTYVAPLSTFPNLSNSTINWSAVESGRFFLYDKVTDQGEITVKFSNFRFIHQVAKDIDGGDDTTGIEEIMLGTDDHVVIYNLSGVQVFAGAYGQAKLPAGLYVVVGSAGSRKVLF